MSKKTVLFIGGDERQIYCARQLSEIGYETALYGFEQYKKDKRFALEYSNLKIAVILADVIVLPTPLMRAHTFFAPFSEHTLQTEEILSFCTKKKTVFGGKIDPKTKESLESIGIEYHDFLADESYLLQTAHLTAQALMCLLMDMSDESISEKNILILGCGKIAKSFLRLIAPFKAKITVAARKKYDLTLVKLLGYDSVACNKLGELGDYDLIINTIPAAILSDDLLGASNADFVDLAGAYACAGKRMYAAGGLPGKYLPKSAGRLEARIIAQLCEVSDE